MKVSRVSWFAPFCAALVAVAAAACAKTSKCQADEESLRALLADAGRCNVDSDCVAIYAGCPFGCENLVNKQLEPKLKARILAYKQGCSRCAYDCEGGVGAITCFQGSCVRRR